MALPGGEEGTRAACAVLHGALLMEQPGTAVGEWLLCPCELAVLLSRHLPAVECKGFQVQEHSGREPAKRVFAPEMQVHHDFPRQIRSKRLKMRDYSKQAVTWYPRGWRLSQPKSLRKLPGTSKVSSAGPKMKERSTWREASSPTNSSCPNLLPSTWESWWKNWNKKALHIM